MPNYNDAQGVADLLSQFDFNIINEGPGDFSTQHRKYTCEFSKPGIESFTTTYQSNPDVHGQPTATDVFAALASDALAVDGLFVDTFADELGFEKPSQAIRAYESCHSSSTRRSPRASPPSRTCRRASTSASTATKSWRNTATSATLSAKSPIPT